LQKKVGSSLFSNREWVIIRYDNVSMTYISCFHIWYFRHSINFILHQGYTWSGLHTIALSFVVCVSYWLTKRQWLSKPVGNTAIQLFCRWDIPELFYATVSTHRCQLVVKYLSKRCQSYRMDAAMFYLHNTEKAVLWLVVLRSQFYFWLANINFR
jgi:hypothetical protein